MGDNYDYMLEVLYLGKFREGKTNLNTPLTKNEVDENKNLPDLETLGNNQCDDHIIEEKDKKFKLQISDSDRIEDCSSYYLGKDFFFIFYDSYDKDSFEKAKTYICEIKNEKEDAIIALINNNDNLNLEAKGNENVITEEEARTFSDLNSVLFFQISNLEKYETEIKELFSLAIRKYLNILEEKKQKEKTIVRKRVKRKKPVIYLYPGEPMDISVQINIKESNFFTVVYPKFNEKNNTWKVHASPNGEITIKNKIYPYLFWEAESFLIEEINEGFIVKDEDAEIFLEEKLKILGLNEKESTDFITFWLPVLYENKLSLCNFQSKFYYDNFELNINPKPDTLLRIFILIKKLNTPIYFKEQKLNSIERKGFTVVEWGGTNY